MNPMQLMSFAWMSQWMDGMSSMWTQAEVMAHDFMGVKKGQTTTAGMKSFVIGVVLIFLTLIIVANFAPEAFGQINDTNLTDVPGGDFVRNTAILLIMLLVGVAVIVKTLDLI